MKKLKWNFLKHIVFSLISATGLSLVYSKSPWSQPTTETIINSEGATTVTVTSALHPGIIVFILFVILLLFFKPIKKVLEK